jgi:hypothetical protein
MDEAKGAKGEKDKLIKYIYTDKAGFVVLRIPSRRRARRTRQDVKD